MKTNVTDIYVYADWVGLEGPTYIGKLSAQQSKGKETYSFEYDEEWVNSKPQFMLDPELDFFTSRQFPAKKNFGVFLDSIPDRWGRVLMQTREAQRATKEKRKTKSLREFDYLLGVDDHSRMGALRFKTAPQGSFLNNDQAFPTPPWTSLRELQYSAKIVEEGDPAKVAEQLARLIAPGSSLGGARPKANILDDNNDLWIAKFPSKNDSYDKGAWEYLTYRLAIKANIQMVTSTLQKVSQKYHTFLTKRFDRINGKRIHFASAMTMTQYDEASIRDTRVSYLELAEFIQRDSKASARSIKEDLHELWRRIIFNIAISNTDDHLRNHGFIIKNNEWRLSPAYDLNPATDKKGLALNIDMANNALDYNLAKDVGSAFFQLSNNEMTCIIQEVKQAVSHWQNEAKRIGIPPSEQQLMESAFNV